MSRWYPLRWLFILLLLLSLPALACGLTGSNDEVEPTAGVTIPEDGVEEVAPGSTATPVAAAEAPAFPDLKTANASLDMFDSYRVEMVISFESLEGDESGTIRFQTARVVEPHASEVIMMMEGALPDELQGIETLFFTEIGDTAYTVFPGFGCITGGVDEMGGTTEEMGDLMDTEELLGEIDDAQFVGEETINGVRTFHYRFDETNVEDSGELEDLDGEIWIAQEGGYVVRMVADGVGQLELFGEEREATNSRVHIEYNVSDVNAAIVIAPPADCESGAGEFPVMEGATGLASMSGFTSYQVEASLEDVIAYYEDEMAAREYTAPADDQLIFEDTALLSFTRGDETVNVTLSREDGIVSVLIVSDTGE